MSFFKSDFFKANIFMHVSILLWGFTAPIGKGIGLNEGLLVWYRLLIVSLSLIVSLYIQKKNWKLPINVILKLGGIGVLLMIHWLFFYAAIKYSNVAVTLSTFASTALFTAILEPLVYRTKIKKEELFFGFITIVGIGVIFNSENHYALGIFLSLMATFVGSFFNILNKNIVKEVDAEVITFYELFSGLLFLTLILPFYIKYFNVQKILPNQSDLILLSILAILCTHITVVFSLKALRHLSAFTLNLAINLEPVYGITLAFVFFKENELLNNGFYMGSAIVFLSVLSHAIYSYYRSKIVKDEVHSNV